MGALSVLQGVLPCKLLCSLTVIIASKQQGVLLALQGLSVTARERSDLHDRIRRLAKLHPMELLGSAPAI